MTPGIPSHLFTAIDHVGLAVADLDAAIDFYEKTFGMKLAHRETNEEQGVDEAMIAIGDSDNKLQLLAPLNENSHHRQVPRPQRPRHAAARLPGHRRRAGLAILKERGVRLLYDAPRRGTADSRINFIHPKDAGGVLVELVEPRHQIPRVHTAVTIKSQTSGRYSPVMSSEQSHPTPNTQEPTMQHILDAILAGDTPGEEFANLEIPDHYRAATVHKDEVDMFEGVADQGEGPAQVAARRGCRPARARSGRGASSR